MEQVNENVAVMSAEEALALFKERVFQQAWCEDDTTMTLEVVSVEMNYAWVREKDADTYLLLPVWDFIGYYYSAQEMREMLREDEAMYRYTILSINAVNGSNVYRGA